MHKVLLSITFIVAALCVMSPYAYSQSSSLTTGSLFTYTSTFVVTSSSAGSMISGIVYGCNMYGQLQPISFASVTANNGQKTYVDYSGGGGQYEMSVPTGFYTVTVAEPGYVSTSESVTVYEGTDVVISFSLAETNGACGTSVASATTNQSVFPAQATIVYSTTTFTTDSASPVPEYPSSLALTLLAVLITLGVLTHRRYARRKIIRP